MATALLRSTLLVALTSLALPGCAALLGIEEASCDSDIDPDNCPAENDDDADDDDDTDDDDASDDDAGDDDTDAGVDAGFDVEYPSEQECEEYCGILEDSCDTDELRQYVDEKACQVICGRYLRLAVDDNDAERGDSFECRLEQAQSAQLGERETGCAAAGVTGDNDCGLLCEVYCDLMDAECHPEFDEYFENDFNNCLQACNDVPRADTRFNSNIQKGNTLECRFYHLMAAAGSARTHCPHAAGRGGVCE